MQTRLWPSFSAGGLLFGTLFLAASLTPTLLPRSFLTQGVISGCAPAAGYGIFGGRLWAYMALPWINDRIILRAVSPVAATGCAILARTRCRLDLGRHFPQESEEDGLEKPLFNPSRFAAPPPRSS